MNQALTAAVHMCRALEAVPPRLQHWMYFVESWTDIQIVRFLERKRTYGLQGDSAGESACHTLEFDFWHYVKSLGMVAFNWNPSSPRVRRKEVETGGSLWSSESASLGEVAWQKQKRPYFHELEGENWLLEVDLWLPYSYSGMLALSHRYLSHTHNDF